jgi:hypothetical protein
VLHIEGIDQASIALHYGIHHTHVIIIPSTRCTLYIYLIHGVIPLTDNNNSRIHIINIHLVSGELLALSATLINYCNCYSKRRGSVFLLHTAICSSPYSSPTASIWITRCTTSQTMTFTQVLIIYKCVEICIYILQRSLRAPYQSFPIHDPTCNTSRPRVVLLYYTNRNYQ